MTEPSDNPLLCEAELERPRSPAEFVRFVEENFDKIDGPSDPFWCNPLSKRVAEEIRPLASFAKHYFSSKDGVQICPKLGNQQYDAQIIFDDKHEFINIEITVTTNGQDRSIELEFLSEHGYAPPASDIVYDGKKGNRQFTEAWENGEESSDRQIKKEKEYCQIKERYNNKKQKNYESDTWLVICFDDYAGFRQNEISELKERIKSDLISDLKFNRLFLAGQSGNNFLKFEKPCKA